MGKYAPLTRFLREREESRITMRFAELEEVLGFSLPASACKYASWWANSASGQSQIKGWRDAGWEARDVDLRGRKITFVRVSGEPVGKPGEQPAAPPAAMRHAPARRRQVAGQKAAGQQAAHGVAQALPAGVLDVSRLPPGMRRLLASRAARNGHGVEQEAAAILRAALAEERAALLDELAAMRGRTRRPGAFDLLQVLGRR